ncbi:MAG: hypothetical protein WC480_05030 [Patescibacteria group bacterium]
MPEEANQTGASPTPPTPTPEPNKAAGGLEPKVAAALSYVLGFITGILFIAVSKDKFVRFHAMQSIITSVVLIVINYLLDYILIHWFWWSLISIWQLFILALFVLLIYKAYNQEKYKLPIIGDYAEKFSEKIK